MIVLYIIIAVIVTIMLTTSIIVYLYGRGFYKVINSLNI